MWSPVFILEMTKRIAIIGGGAAGFFSAICMAEKNPHLDISIFEKSNTVLGKVKISGGGRCNVTHHCFNPKDLIQYYPRGGKQLLGPFHTFGPTQTIEWFKKYGVSLKTEDDGRMFPTSDNSATIINCFLDAVDQYGIKVKTQSGIEKIIPKENGRKGWTIQFQHGGTSDYDAIILATGSSSHFWDMLKELSIDIVSPVPSLFTFNCKDARLKDLAGVSFKHVKVAVQQTKLQSEGPLLITHWGLSGPGILKLSSFGATHFADTKYQFKIRINFLPTYNEDELFEELNHFKSDNPKKQIITSSCYSEIPKRYWQQLIETLQLENKNWADASKQDIRKLTLALCAAEFSINGKSTNKDEFVTCGGIDLNEIDFKKMKVKKYENLYAAGEVMNIDAVTGGFNFQNAWTSGYISARAIIDSFDN